MVTISRRLATVRPTQTSPALRNQTDSVLRDLAFVLKMTSRVKQQIVGAKEEADLALAGACK